MVDGEASINNVNKIFPRYTSLVPLSPSNKYKDMEAPLRSAGVSLVAHIWFTDRKGQEIRCKTKKIAKAPGVGMCVDWVVERGGSDCPILLFLDGLA